MSRLDAQKHTHNPCILSRNTNSNPRVGHASTLIPCIHTPRAQQRSNWTTSRPSLHASSHHPSRIPGMSQILNFKFDAWLTLQLPVRPPPSCRYYRSNILKTFFFFTQNRSTIMPQTSSVPLRYGSVQDEKKQGSYMAAIKSMYQKEKPTAFDSINGGPMTYIQRQQHASFQHCPHISKTGPDCDSMQVPE